MSKSNNEWVSTGALQSELKAMRWEMRALIALAGVANLGLTHALNVPGVSDATGLLVSIF